MLETITIGISLGCVYGLVALGVSLIYRTTGVLSFAQGAFVMVGGMVGAWLADDVGLPLGLALLGGTAAGALGGLVLAVAIVIPLWKRGASPFMVVLGTLVFLVISENLVLNGLGSQPRAVHAITPDWKIHVVGQTIDSQVLWVLLATALIGGALYLLLMRSRFGAAMRACAIDQQTSRLLGVSPTRVAVSVFVLTAAIAALVGLLIAPIQFSAYSAAQAYGVKGFLAAVIGGLGDVRGAVIGGLLVGLSEAFIGVYVSSTYLELILLGILLAVLLLRPRGVLPGMKVVAAR
jgi:branched-chain amino acid transport system permease protein